MNWSSSPPAWLGKALKVAACAGGLAVAAPLTIILSAPLWQQRWVTPRPHADLSPTLPFMDRSEVKAGDAFDLLWQARQAAEGDKNFSLPAQTLQQNTRALDLLRRAADAPNPRVPTPLRMNDSIAYATIVSRLSPLLCFSARQKAADGDWQGAFDELNTVLRLGSILANGGTLPLRLIAAESSGLALDTMNQLAAEHQIPAPLLLTESRWLTACEQNLPPPAETLKQDYDCFIRTFTPALSHLAADKPAWFTQRERWSAYSFVYQICGSNTRRDILADLNSLHQLILEHIEQPYRHDATVAFNDKLIGILFAKPYNFFNMTTTRSFLGLMLARLGFSKVSLVRGIILENQFYFRATRLNLSVSAYAQDHGHPPADLTALLPKYLDAIPADPFLEPHPLHYRADSDHSWLIYSVGFDQIDNHGTPIPGPKPDKFETINQQGDLVITGTLHRQ